MDNDSLGTQTSMCNSLSSAEPSLDQASEPPPLCHLDLGVIESLPPELFTELNGIYGGKLVDYVAKIKQENSSATVPHEQTHGSRSGGERPLVNDVVPKKPNSSRNQAYSSRKRRNSFFCGRVPCGSFYIRSWKR